MKKQKNNRKAIKKIKKLFFWKINTNDELPALLTKNKGEDTHYQHPK